jgi:hypothetical protein
MCLYSRTSSSLNQILISFSALVSKEKSLALTKDLKLLKSVFENLNSGQKIF